MLVLKINNYFIHSSNIEDISGEGGFRVSGPPRYGLDCTSQN
jgi:hypothetical protein